MMQPTQKSCKLVGLGGLCCWLIQEHSVSNLEGWWNCVLIMYLLLSVLGPAHMRLSKSPSFCEALYNLLLVCASVHLSTAGLVLSVLVLSLWEVWGHVHRAGRKGIPWWNSACCNNMQTTHMVGWYPSPVPLCQWSSPACPSKYS